MEKLAIQRLVRGDDGLTKVIYIDLQTLQQIDDLSNYRIVNSGELYPEPVATVDDPETPSSVQSSNKDPMLGRDTDPAPVGGRGTPVTPAPSAPNQVVTPDAIRSPESRVPEAVSPPATVETPKAPSPTSLGALGGIKTAQGSILPELDINRFNPVMDAFPEQAPTSKSGSISPSQLERQLESRRELENIKDADLGAQTHTFGNATRTKDDAFSRGIETHPNSLDRTKDDVQRGIATYGNPSRVKDDEYMSTAPRGAIDAGIQGGRYSNSAGGFISVDQHLDNVDNRRESLMAQKDEDLGPGFRTSPTLGTKDDVVERAQQITSGAPTTIASRPERVGSLPAAGIKTSPTLGTKDDWAGPQGTTQTHSVFDTSPASTSGASRSVAGKVKEVASKPQSVAERTTGFVSAQPNREKARTTNFIDEAGYSQTERTGTAGWRNNNPGNIETGKFARSQEGYLGAAGGIQSPSGHLKANERFAVFDTLENGRKAQENLITGKYKEYTISNMMKAYAPDEGYGTPQQYADAIAGAIGVDPDTTKIGDLTPGQQRTMFDAMHVHENNTPGTSRVSLTSKGIAARDDYTGLDTGSDTPSERNAANRPSSGTQFGAGGSRGVASNIGRNDSAGAGRGSSPGGPSVSRSGSDRSGSQSNHSAERERDNSLGGRSSVSGASRSTAGKTGYSAGNTSGTTSGHGLGIGRA